jgi:dynein heavy chain
MKVELRVEEVKLQEAERDTNVMLMDLEKQSMAAKTESDKVMVIKESCLADAANIGLEKKAAEEDLAKAQPFLDEAQRAVDSIKANDLTELKKLAKPTDIIKLVFDCVMILLMEPLQKVQKAQITLGIGKEKKTFDFITDSFVLAKQGMLTDTRFLANLFDFSKFKKDMINDETVEFMSCYHGLEGFNPLVARNASKAAEGLCAWVQAMTFYHEASKVVKPKLEALELASGRLEVAQSQLRGAEANLKKCQDVLDKLKQDFEDKMASKRAIEQGAMATKKRMEQATSLIDGLAGERKRWTEDSERFAHTKLSLVGDCALGSAFVSYAGPFSQEFRAKLVFGLLMADLKERDIPVTEGLELSSFLVDLGTVGDWNMQGLPTDSLSIENGIMVTSSSRYPLLIDPQGQGLNWIKEREKDNMPSFGISTLDHPKVRDQLEFCMSEGKALILCSVDEDVDPMLTPVLEKHIIKKAKSMYINVADKMCEYNESFMLYMTTRLPNPHFSPEVQARTTLVDFTVTQRGLEEQLLGRVIQKEQRSLEDQLKEVLEGVNNNTKALIGLDALLLERLSANTGNLLDDAELVGVLANTKKKATEVNEKLLAAGEMKESINEKREQYRPVATRGSVLYFSIVEMSSLNCMYQTSLDQFMGLFLKSMDIADKASLAFKRVNNICTSMTALIWKYVSQGLYERDKLSFTFMVTLKIMVTCGSLRAEDVKLFLKCGSLVDETKVRQKPFTWMPKPVWLNVLALAKHGNEIFKSLPEDISKNETHWRRWYDDNAPEKTNAPEYEPRFVDDTECGAFYRLLLLRAMREDRAILAILDFVSHVETIDGVNGRIPAMGPDFMTAPSGTVDSAFKEMTHTIPVIYLLSAGADPTESIEQYSRKKKQIMQCVSMGEGQEVVAMKAINAAVVNGSWVLLQNCHLGLDFMDGMEDLLLKIRDTCHPEFRMFITADPHPDFSIALLQMSIKVTNEAPAGMRAGVLRSYTVIVDQDKLERVDSVQWRALMYAICFLHSVVQERRKFGALGWNIPYEFNNSDLNASLSFLEKHLYSGPISWPTVQYMVAEVQYGGRITDDLDSRLFKTYSQNWLQPMSLSPNFTFNPENPVSRIPNDFVYSIPDGQEVEEYVALIDSFPSMDSPEIFGLHPNADLTFRVKEVHGVLNSLGQTQPKNATNSDSGGQTKDEAVMSKATDFLSKLPEIYNDDDVREKIHKIGGMGSPLTIVLFQEVQRMQTVIRRVRAALTQLQQAIKGEVVVTREMLNVLDAVYDARVPQSWMYSAGGDELSWLCPALGLWFASLLQRDNQLHTWLNTGRPNCFWMSGFTNPQGFLTAMKQEVTRQHKLDKWALDDVVFHTEVTEYERVEQVLTQFVLSRFHSLLHPADFFVSTEIKSCLLY